MTQLQLLLSCQSCKRMLMCSFDAKETTHIIALVLSCNQSGIMIPQLLQTILMQHDKPVKVFVPSLAVAPPRRWLPGIVSHITSQG